MIEGVTMQQKLIGIALALFREKGYEQVTVNEICAKAKVTKPTFYYHLKSKDDILITFYNEVIQDLTECFLTVLSSNNHWEQCHMLFVSLINQTKRLGPDLVSQTHRINLQGNLGKFDLVGQLSKFALIIIERAQANGQIRAKGKPEDLYRAAAYLFLGCEYTWCLKDGNFDWDQEFFRPLELLFDVDPQFTKLRYQA